MRRAPPFLSARFTRRRTLAGLSAGVAWAAAPSILKAQTPPVKLGVLQPLSGALAFSGQQGRLGAELAIADINQAGGIKTLGGAKLEPIFSDAQSRPDIGAAETEKLNEAGAAAVIGGYASSICLAASQAAARSGLPYVVDVGVADEIVSRGLANTFRFGPGFAAIVETAMDNLEDINEGAGAPAKTAVIIHEDSLFGAGLAKMLNDQLPSRGLDVLETIPHPTPVRDFNTVALRLRSLKPDIIIPSNYYNEFVLLARTLQQQRITPMAIYAVLGGAASSFRFVKEFPQAAEYVMDCNHWFDPTKPAAAALQKRVEERGFFFTYECFLNYCCVGLVADALERAATTERGKLTEALAASVWDGHIMPYGPTKFVQGQNQSAAPVNTQVLKGKIEVIFPDDFASAEAVYPRPGRS
jgi:branched-chain amino acid transport system substrate-binding protein